MGYWVYGGWVWIGTERFGFRVSAFPRSGGWALNDGVYAFVVGAETHPQAF